jgi:acyl dehydratase
MIDRSFIGCVSRPRTIEVEKGQLKFFAKATGEQNPIYFDEETARRAGYRALPAPPTFTFSLALGAPAERGELLRDMGIDMHAILHGEQTFRHFGQIYAGDRITLTTETVDIFSKKDGQLEFVLQRTRAQNQEGQLCTEMDVLTVVRNTPQAPA